MKYTRIAALGALSSVSLFAATASAGQPEYHDGFQFRGAVGIGYLTNSEPQDVTVHGGAGSLEAYLGGMPVRGLAIGGFFSVATAVGPSISVPDVTFTASSSHASLTLFTLGPYIDYYPNPHEGLHVLGTVGFASLTSSYDDGNVNVSSSASGFTLGGGIGYDWWVAADWSIGILGRVTFASLSRDSGSETSVAPTILFSFSYN